MARYYNQWFPGNLSSLTEFFGLHRLRLIKKPWNRNILDREGSGDPVVNRIVETYSRKRLFMVGF